MRLVLLTTLACVVFSTDTAQAQQRRGVTITRSYYPATPVYRTPTFSTTPMVVTPYNAGLLDLRRNYGPNYTGNYVPVTGATVGFSGGGFSNGYFGSGPLPNFGSMPTQPMRAYPIRRR